ncbi:TPM domain-containing protein [Solitalea koreensis]|uniref:TLP18.3, Psb32 and MOLO-1 founding protein of phosphatase n=1 Tax=Solitalea koreensis TaxID=543615 RepID=A0A521CSM6_9SPHI|nr:TPM domain-containing protein [Solitalea koreensis]SMO62385.1 TLP18.3, Psb32 and MOLO-1 founding protein of phosphatase [Solitalea koreensis]
MPFLQEHNKQRVKKAIQAAESLTSGEIRVCVERRCSEDVLDRAVFYFKELEMHNTRERNGVLIYLAIDDHKFAIIGDAGINAVVETEFWNKTKEIMRSSFKEGNLVDGVILGIEEAGRALQKYFPYTSDDKNELSDDIYIGND